jgi:flagellar protein FlaH
MTDEIRKRSGVYSAALDRDELNERLGGGIPMGSIMLIEGSEGSGRSVICQRLCYGFLSNNHTVTYISTEMTVKDFIDQMYSLNFRIADYLLSNKLLYIPVYPLIGSTKSRRDFLDKLMRSPVIYKKEILIVDSLSSLIAHSLDEDRIFDFLAFLKKLVSAGRTVIFTVEEGHKQIEPLRLASDILLSLRIRTTSEGIQRMILVKRFARSRGRVQDIIFYRIEHMAGIVIELTEVSG